MALTGVLRAGFVQLRVLDMEGALTHYINHVGLDEVERAADGRVYLKGWDEFDRHSFILREADSAGMDVMGFKVVSDDDLDRFEVRIKEFGLEVDHVAAGEQPGVGRRIGFTIPTGHRIELYAEITRSENGPAIENPYATRDQPRGMNVLGFDHCLLYGPGIAESTRFFTEVLDFDLPEKIETPDGDLAVWLTSSNKSHEVAFVEHEAPGKFYHAAFQLENYHDVGHAGDVITRFDISRDIGPTRHGITRGHTIYFFDPSGNRNEVYQGGYRYFPDHPTRVWTPDHIGRGIFYYERELNEAFLNVVT